MKLEKLIEHRDVIFQMRVMERAAARACRFYNEALYNHHKKQVETLTVAWDSLNYEAIHKYPGRVECTHTEHCCVYHGCKYGDEDCPVATKVSIQSFRCESCDDYHYDEFDL